MYVVGGKTVPHEVRFRVPDGWLVQMSLPRRDRTRCHFIAPDYDTIVDAPVELGHLTVRRFQVGDAIYSIVLDFRDPSSRSDRSRRSFAGSSATRWACGARRRRTPSTSSSSTTDPGSASSTSRPRRSPFRRCSCACRGPGVFDSLYAHEYFHLWNVKRLRPKQLGPFDYTQPVRTKALWLCEGITDYYADVTCWRTGIWSDGKFLATMQDEIQRLQTTPARLMETVEASSWAAFDRGYDGLGTQQYVDYYNKGKLIGLVLRPPDPRPHARRTLARRRDARPLREVRACRSPDTTTTRSRRSSRRSPASTSARSSRSTSAASRSCRSRRRSRRSGSASTPGESDTKAALAWWQRSRARDRRRTSSSCASRPSRSPRFGLSAGDRVLAVNERPLPAAQRPQDVLGALVPRDAGAAVVRVRRGEETKDRARPVPARATDGTSN